MTITLPIGIKTLNGIKLTKSDALIPADFERLVETLNTCSALEECCKLDVAEKCEYCYYRHACRQRFDAICKKEPGHNRMNHKRK